jgi:16S rRNA (cytidine1402-2'-O)-methyltransferase
MPGLYVVATPIGNLGDITIRAKEVLAGADVIACEDTRVTGGLLSRFSISTTMTPYHDHNAERVRPVLIERLKSGGRVALVSDAGTPLISDPGFKLVAACAAEGITVVPVPGASAMLAALVTAALPTDRVMFAGFLPNKAGARDSALEELKSLRATLVFYESAQRLPEATAAMARVLGPRPAAVCRELTKLHEEIRRAPLDQLAAHYESAGAPKGEVVIVVGGAGKDAQPQDSDIDAALAAALKSMSLRDAVDAVAEALKLPRRTVYARALELAKISAP